jgi:hypothetical protein
MNLFLKLDSILDYNNTYTIKKVVSILNSSFDSAIESGNLQQVNDVVRYTRKIYDKLSLTYRESEDYGETMSYSQKMWANRLRNFLAHMIKTTRSNFGIANYETEIERAIS